MHFVEVDGGVGIVLLEDGRALLLCQGPPIVPPSRQFMGHVPPGVEVVHEAIDGVVPVPEAVGASDCTGRLVVVLAPDEHVLRVLFADFRPQSRTRLLSEPRHRPWSVLVAQSRARRGAGERRRQLGVTGEAQRPLQEPFRPNTLVLG